MSSKSNSAHAIARVARAMIKCSINRHIGTNKHLSKVSVSSISVGDVDVIPVHSAKNLGSWFDLHTDMDTH